MVKKLENKMTAGRDHELVVYFDLLTKYGTTRYTEGLLLLFLQSKYARLLKPLQVHSNKVIVESLFIHAIEKGVVRVLMDYYKDLFAQHLP